MVAYARKRKHKWIWGVVFVVLVTIGVTLGMTRPWEKRGEGTETSHRTESSSSSESGAVVDNAEKSKDELEEKVEETTQYEGTDPNEAEGLSGVVTYAGIVGEELVIRVNIDQYLAGGSCRLELTRWNEVQYSETVGIVDAAATSTCEGFNVPISKLAVANYGIRILVESGGKSGVITGEVNQ